MSRDTSMRGDARRARTYSYGQHGRQTRGMMGDHVLRKGAGVEVWKPSLAAGSHGAMPCFDSKMK